jgi:hypothetical protein
MDGDEKRRLMQEDGKVWPMVMSVGYNPYFKNEKVTAVSRHFSKRMCGQANGAGGPHHPSIPERLLRA